MSTRHFMILALVCCAGCAAEGIQNASSPPTVTTAVGQTVTIDVRSVMASAWDSVPQVSSGAVRFVNETQPGELRNPAGPTQRFTFQALSAGRATVTLHRAGTSDVSTYIVDVR